MTKKLTFILLIVLLSTVVAFGQTKIAEVTFEAAGGYTTSVSEFTDGGTDYFTRTDGANIGAAVSLSNIQGSYYFAAQDTDGDGGPDNLTLDFNNINISGYTNLELRVHLAEDDDGANQDWDANTYLHITATIDANPTEDLIWIEATGTNTEPQIDTDFNGVGDGAAITDTFTQYTQNITGTGSSLDVQFIFNFLDAGDEDIAIDNIEIWGLASGTQTINVTPTSLSGFTYVVGAGPSAEQTFTVSGVNLTNDISLTAPANFEISTTSGSGFGTNINLTQSGGNVPNTTIYTRMAAGLAVNTYGGNVSANSTGATTQNVALSGTVTNPTADVVITEIMYNTPGGDDEWIEICNESGSVQDISNYIVDVDGTTEFTFPASTTIANNTCITVSLGSNGDGTYNNDCPFTPDFGIGASTNNNGALVNNTDPITLFAADGTTVADTVTYDDGDGADGNGSSLHVIDINQDNSSTGSNWQEVDLGGSPGTNTLVPSCLPAVVEINVEGNLGAFPDIVDGDTTPSGTDNTLFAAQFIGSSQAKSYRIQNLGGVNLTVGTVTLSGDVADFNVSVQPASPIVYGTPSIFEVTFAPLSTGVKTAIVSIPNNDSDENPYTFTIEGEGLCVAGSNTISPSSGPIGTIVTVNGTDLSTATATFNGVSATVNNISATLMEITVPSGATTGNLIIVDDNGCTTTIPFSVLDSQISSCEGGSSLSELFISEVTDATYGSLTYIELYNATGSAVNLSNYSLSVYANGETDPLNALSETLSGTINANSTFIIAMGIAPPLNNNLCNAVPGGDGSYADYSCTTLLGVNKKSNEHDYIGLYNSGVLVDEFGVFGDDDWMDTVHTSITGDRGFNFRRLNTATPLPSTAFDDNDWNIIDWVGSGSGSCSTNDYSNIDVYDFSTGTPPTVTTQPSSSSSCDLTATLTIAGTEGFSGGNSLAYQWFYSAPGDAGWTAVVNNATYSGATAATLTINNVLNTLDYQFYCQLREDDSNCYRASDATRLDIQRTTWDGSAWNSSPDVTKIAVIDGNYDTSVGGAQVSFDACNLIVNTSRTLDIRNSTYVRIADNVINDGTIIVQTHGAFVQDGTGGSAGTFTNNGTARVLKQTELLNDWYEYTYWSSPVDGETIENVLSSTPSNRRFWFNAANYLDQFMETNNDNTAVAGQDDIDDDGNDWQIASGTMLAGLGYAATSSPSGLFPGTDIVTFEEAFNTGDISTSIIVNGFGADNDWNLLGNPYPSAIDFDDLHATNSTLIDGAAFLWSHASPPSGTNNGNQNLNFNANDYAIITVGSGNTAGGSGVIPAAGNFIPSGQGFFVRGLANGTLDFDNSMRRADLTSNDQFFAPAGSSVGRSVAQPNRLWLNLTSDNGVFNQILVAYVEGATDGNDGFTYDATRNLSSGLASIIYTRIESSPNRKYAIQGKSPASLDLNETIPIGFETSISVKTIYKFSIAQLEGEFMNSNPIYIIDRYQNKIHDLTASDYIFGSAVGEFKDRFEIVFKEDDNSKGEYQVPNSALSIIELNNDNVKFSLDGQVPMTSIEIYDLLGRLLYEFNAEMTHESVFALHHLSQSHYVAKVTLANGQVLTKKALKSK